MQVMVDGNALARELRESTAASFAALVPAGGPPPKVCVVQIGDDAAASMYTRRLQRTFADSGVAMAACQLAATVTEAEALAQISQLSQDPGVHGIQIQTPLPAHVSLSALLSVLDPGKDLDGIHPHNAGLLAQGRPRIAPATPSGGMAILSHYGVPLSGARAVVVGRSTTVGRPMALLLLQQDATVTICHTRTRDLASVVRNADIVVAAAGRAGLVTADMIGEGAAVIDFGVNVVDGKTVGDVEAAAAERASLFTPVPGGTGPMTNAMLLRNALQLYQDAVGAARS